MKWDPRGGEGEAELPYKKDMSAFRGFGAFHGVQPHNVLSICLYYYLTIRLWARDFYETVDALRLVFSGIQLVICRKFSFKTFGKTEKIIAIS